ncbi:MAG: CoA pyrophosphatase [Pseudomonadota bacterium]
MLSLSFIRAAVQSASSLPETGDHAIGRGGYSVDFAAQPINAAVLVPLVQRRDGLSVILTKRASALRKHAGQVAFPGGRQDREDRDSTHTALREAHEEIGLPPEQVDILGSLSRYRTGTGFAITPIVGVVPEHFSAVPEPGEVEEVFEADFQALMDPANHKIESAVWKGKRRDYYVLPHERHYIWGATAGILVGLSQLIQRAGEDTLT